MTSRASRTQTPCQRAGVFPRAHGPQLAAAGIPAAEPQCWVLALMNIEHAYLEAAAMPPVSSVAHTVAFCLQLKQLDAALRALKAPAHDLTHLLGFISLNLAAVRKILKKYGKEVEVSHAAHPGAAWLPVIPYTGRFQRSSAAISRGLVRYLHHWVLSKCWLFRHGL